VTSKKKHDFDICEWEQSDPHEVRAACVWKIEAYRIALFLAGIGWRDVTKLSEDSRTRSLSNQRHRAPGSISANLEGGEVFRSGLQLDTWQGAYFLLPPRALTLRIVFL
jgi:hypothetical protein